LATRAGFVCLEKQAVQHGKVFSFQFKMLIENETQQRFNLTELIEQARAPNYLLCVIEIRLNILAMQLLLYFTFYLLFELRRRIIQMIISTIRPASLQIFKYLNILINRKFNNIQEEPNFTPFAIVPRPNLIHELIRKPNSFLTI
jgi:hypothetical protein